MANVLKLLRNNQLFATREAALANINAKAQTLGDGEMWVATYGQNGTAKSIIAIKRTWGTTIIDIEEIAGEIQQNLFKYKMVGLTAEEISQQSDPNIKEAYKLVSYQGEETQETVYTQVGEIVKIYKDSSLKEVYLGAGTDTVDASTGVATKYAYELISNPSTQITADAYDALTAEQKALYQPIDSQSLNLIYQLADGTYTIAKVDVSKFLSESEFGDGLQVNQAGVVSLQLDPTSEKDSQSTPVDFLTVGANGIKVQGIRDEIGRLRTEIVGLLADKADASDLEDLNDDVLKEIEAGNGIDVSTKADNAQTISVKLNTTASDNALSLDTDGLYFSKTIDCGSY